MMFALRKSILRISIFRTRITNLHPLVCRQLTSGEVATALRPFLFSVHPDLFGQHPRERAVNEQSLKALNEYVTSLQAGRPVKPAHVSFYVRGGTDGKNDADFREIRLSLVSHDLSVIIRGILNSCDLSLEYVNTLETDQSMDSFPRPIRWHQSYYSFTGKQNPEEQLYKTPTVTLRTWLRKNEEDARAGQRQTRPIKDEVERVRTELKEKIGLADLTWESSWGIRHFRGCLRSFQILYGEREHWINDALKGRRLIFSNCTGYSLHGDVVLSSEDVPSDWLKLLKSLPAYDTVLERLPYMESQLSNLLSNVCLVRRRQKHFITATHYELLLNKLMNSLRRVQDEVICRLFAEDLSHLELVVDSEESPLTLSPEGQFLVPASLPADQVIEFICSNKSEAEYLLGSSAVSAQLESGVVDRCVAQLELMALLKEDSVSSTQMIDCCERLIQSYFDIGLSLKDACLCISHYYTVMGDGQIHIPWDWQLESNAL